MNAQQLIMLGLQASIMLTVFGFGLQATAADLLYLIRRPSLLLRSLVAMFVIIPVFVVGLAKMFDLLPAVRIALVALSISPLPPLLPGKQRKAGGDASFGLGLMVIVGLLSIVLVPIAADLLGRYLGKPFAMSSMAIAAVVLKMAILPLVIGFIVRAVLPSIADRLAKPVALIAKVLLLIGVLIILIAMLPTVLSLMRGGTLLALAAFIVAGLAVGHVMGGPEEDSRIVLGLSTANRHPGIALAIAKANFPDEPNVGATILLYLLVGAVIGMGYQRWHRRRSHEPLPALSSTRG